MMKIVGLLFGAGFSTTKLIALASAAATVIGLITWNQVRQYNKGWNAAIAAIAAEDQKAVDHAIRARSTVRECRDSGGVWRQDAGKCERR